MTETRRRGRLVGRTMLEDWTDPSGHKWTIEINVKVIGGREEVVRFAMTPVDGAASLNQRALRAVPFAEIVSRRAARPSRAELESHQETTGSSGELHKRHRAARRDVIGRRTAFLYKEAYAARQPVQQAVADGLQVPVSTAAKWIMRARAMGLLDMSAEESRLGGVEL